MTEKTEVAVAHTNNLLAAMNVNADVGMNEIVSVFVAKYEGNMIAKKDELSAKLKVVKKELADIDTDLINGVDKARYNVVVPFYGYKIAATDVSVQWEKSYSCDPFQVRITVAMTDPNAAREDRQLMTQYLTEPIPKEVIARRAEILSTIDSLTAELAAVLTELKAVSRKERQIRGRISEMKLAQSGYSGLMDNPELLQLIEMK
jgi:hypothetical protein